MTHQNRPHLPFFAPYNAHPKVVPLIKHAKLMWFSKHSFSQK